MKALFLVLPAGLFGVSARIQGHASPKKLINRRPTPLLGAGRTLHDVKIVSFGTSKLP